jgi:hypothetical protein
VENPTIFPSEHKTDWAENLCFQKQSPVARAVPKRTPKGVPEGAAEPFGAPNRGDQIRLKLAESSRDQPESSSAHIVGAREILS